MAEPSDTILSGFVGGTCGGATGWGLGYLYTSIKLNSTIAALTMEHLAASEVGIALTQTGYVKIAAAQSSAAVATVWYLAIGLLAGVGGGIVGHFFGDYIEDLTGSEGAGTAAAIGSGALTGAAIGFAIGSAVPIVGQLAGAVIGGVCGAIGGFIGSLF